MSDLGFDLFAVDTVAASERGAWMTIKTTDGSPLLSRDGKPVRLRLLGRHSQRYKLDVREATTSMARKGIDQDAMEARTIKSLANATLGWDEVNDKSGKPREFSVEAASEMYTAYPFIREQADRFIGDLDNFTSAS